MAEDDLLSLARDLADAPRRAAPLVRKAVEVTARNIKRDWSENASRTGLTGYAKSVDYDIIDSRDGVRAEIGPNPRKKQGVFGFVEDAPGDVRSAPQHAGRDALEANHDDFDAGLATALWDAAGGRGLR